LAAAVLAHAEILEALERPDDSNPIASSWRAWPAKWGHDLSTLPVRYLEVDDEAAVRILLADNRTSDLATYDEPALAALLTDLAQQSPMQLAGTGYDGDELDSIIANLSAVDVNDASGGDPRDNPWEVLRYVVPPDVHARFVKVLAQMPGRDDIAKLRAMVKRASRA
jgi:hypothetical protein